MAISFDSLPNAPQANVIPAGAYIATIEKATMKQPKDDKKPPYLNLQLDIKDAAGKSYGKLFDIITESESEYMRYKLRCFIQAIDVNLGKVFELRDLTKVCVGKKCEVTVVVDDKNNPPRSQINMFAADMYKHISNVVDPFADADMPFTMGDATEPSDSAY